MNSTRTSVVEIRKRMTYHSHISSSHGHLPQLYSNAQVERAGITTYRILSFIAVLAEDIKGLISLILSWNSASRIQYHAGGGRYNTNDCENHNNSSLDPMRVQHHEWLPPWNTGGLAVSAS